MKGIFCPIILFCLFLGKTSAQTSTQEVLDRHLIAVDSHNLAAILQDYDETSIIATRESLFKGLKEIEGFFKKILPQYPQGNTTGELITSRVVGNMAYIVWNSKSPYVNIPVGTDTFIIENNKIKYQTFTVYNLKSKNNN
ncbi:nuclear transport factor 2 family protein [Flagellimonas nanhaiensis]|uniref:Nuclear transport factor 2 family protein n=1 Tax=Flagellimonas nanhaiensis TaxID=2292706 RepID=A0A371JT11_9FLAO|nr:nuclear transport factor 2 family protein [Allomuricauda nanhaiensis]RDY60937.1 nuclear transport factor 2 family protein [Allomuricauda nanhaiensis]